MTSYIWKEWKEQLRGKGLWIGLGMVALVSVFIFLEARQYPTEQSFEAFLLSLYEMNVYLLPLLSLFISSFSFLQEKELKTMLILTTKKESFRTFLIKKSVAIQSVTLVVFITWYFLLALPMKMFLPFHVEGFFHFLLTVIVFVVIFNQIGILLGSLCATRMQLVGVTVFIWFFFLFLVDLVFLYVLPSVTYDNVFLFSIFFFLHPMNTLRLYLESSLGMFSMEHMSRLMEQLVWMSPAYFLLMIVIAFLLLSFEGAVWFRHKEVK